jgi:hypothetical protein
MTELWHRGNRANYFAIFQDDVVLCKDTKAYIEATPFPNKVYLNLYCVPVNEELKPEGHEGWYPSNQAGQGALALVFNREGVSTLLSSHYFMKRTRGQAGGKGIDGIIIDTMKKAGWTEYVHKPSLCMHTGSASTLGNRWRKTPETFRGEDFSPMQIICPDKNQNCLVT